MGWLSDLGDVASLVISPVGVVVEDVPCLNTVHHTLYQEEPCSVVP